MKKKLVLLLTIGCLVLGGCGASESTDAGSKKEVSEEKVAKGSPILDNPAGIGLQNPKATQGDKLTYQLGNSVAIFDANVEELILKPSGYTEFDFLIPEQTSWMRFFTGIDAATIYRLEDDERAYCFLSVVGEEDRIANIDGKERTYVEDGVFYTADDHTGHAYAEISETEYILLYEESYSSGFEDDSIEEFEKDLDLVLECVDVCPNVTVMSEEAVSVTGKTYNLSEYPVWQDVCTLALYETWGIKLEDSNSFVDFSPESFRLSVGNELLCFQSSSHSDEWEWDPEKINFTMETSKFLVEAIMEENAVVVAKFSYQGEEYSDMYTQYYMDGFEAEGITDSEEHFKAYLSEYFK